MARYRVVPRDGGTPKVDAPSLAGAYPRTAEPATRAPGKRWTHDRRQQGLGRSVGSDIEYEDPIALPEAWIAGPVDDRRPDVRWILEIDAGRSRQPRLFGGE